VWKAVSYLKNPGQIIFRDGCKQFAPLRFRNGVIWDGINEATAFIFAEIFIYDMYPLRLSKPDPVIVDIGANIGCFSLYAHLRYPQAKIYSVEADPAVYKVAAENIASNGLADHINLKNLALSSSDGIIALFQSEVSGWSSLYDAMGARQGRKIEVESLSLTSFCRKTGITEIDFLKIDIEGAEYDLIMGDPDFFTIPIREIIMEVDKVPRCRKWSFDEILCCLRARYSSVTITNPQSDYPLVHARNV
jgi:FkbM family methyltransferase